MNLIGQDLRFVIIREELLVDSLVVLLVHAGLDQKIFVLIGVPHSVSLVSNSCYGLWIVCFQEVTWMKVLHIDEFVSLITIVDQEGRASDLQLAFAVKQR